MKTALVVIALLVFAAVVDATNSHHHKRHHKKRNHHKHKAHHKVHNKHKAEAGEWNLGNLMSDITGGLFSPNQDSDEEVVEAASDPCAHAKTADGKWIRREWRDMTDSDKRTFLAAVNKLKASGEYDKYPLSHKKLDQVIHGVNIFYPWHRKFLLNYEIELRNQGKEFQCLTLPFWDWTQDAKDPENSPVFDSELGFGSLKEGWVDDGPFAGWTAAKHVNGKACLHRNPGGVACGGWPQALPTAAVLKQFVLSRSFQNFWGNTEGYPHGGPHCFVGGNMAQMSSPDDPIFFLHHGFIDKIMYDWQRCHDYDKNPKDISDWENAFPWPNVRKTRMPMHPSMSTSNVEAIWDPKQAGFVYKDDRYEEQTGFLHMCDNMYGRKGIDAKSHLTEMLLETGVNATMLKHHLGSSSGDGEGEGVSGIAQSLWKKIAARVRSAIVFMDKLSKGGSAKEAVKEAAKYECTSGETDSESEKVDSAWAERNNLGKICDAGFCSNPCKQVLGEAEPAPGSASSEDVDKHPSADSLGSDEVEDYTDLEAEIYAMKPDEAGDYEAGDSEYQAIQE